MQILITILVAFVVFCQIIFGLIEIFGSPELQAKSFDFSVEDLKLPSTHLGLQNQGIYNIAFGLMGFYFLAIQSNWQVLAGLMAFVVIVGIYGGSTVTKKVYFVQALPALITLVLLVVFN